MKDNTIVELFKADERNVEMVVSHLFYTDQNKHLLFKYKVRNGETIETKSINNFRYCEVTVEGVSMISLSLFDENQFEVKLRIHVGWMKGTIGYHSDDGGIYHDEVRIAELQPYGDVVDFNGKTSEVLFTFNGEIVFKKELNWNSYFLAIGCEDIRLLKLNCGDQPFLFQI